MQFGSVSDICGVGSICSVGSFCGIGGSVTIVSFSTVNINSAIDCIMI